MALETKDGQACSKCGRRPVRVYKVNGKWVCGKCIKK